MSRLFIIIFAVAMATTVAAPIDNPIDGVVPEDTFAAPIDNPIDGVVPEDELVLDHESFGVPSFHRPSPPPFGITPTRSITRPGPARGNTGPVSLDCWKKLKISTSTSSGLTHAKDLAHRTAINNARSKCSKAKQAWMKHEHARERQAVEEIQIFEYLKKEEQAMKSNPCWHDQCDFFLPKVYTAWMKVVADYKMTYTKEQDRKTELKKANEKSLKHKAAFVGKKELAYKAEAAFSSDIKKAKAAKEKKAKAAKEKKAKAFLAASFAALAKKEREFKKDQKAELEKRTKESRQKEISNKKVTKEKNTKKAEIETKKETKGKESRKKEDQKQLLAAEKKVKAAAKKLKEVAKKKELAAASRCKKDGGCYGDGLCSYMNLSGCWNLGSSNSKSHAIMKITGDGLTSRLDGKVISGTSSLPTGTTAYGFWTITANSKPRMAWVWGSKLFGGACKYSKTHGSKCKAKVKSTCSKGHWSSRIPTALDWGNAKWSKVKCP